jgi:hypothetical protein
MHEVGWEEGMAIGEEEILHIFRWDPEDPVHRPVEYPGRDYTAIRYEEVRSTYRALLRRWGPSERNVLAAAVLAYGLVVGSVSEDTRHWVEKTPYNERFADLILQWWPKAKFLHILRDPRDNYASYRRKHPEWTLETFALSWGESARLGSANQARSGERRYLLIRYEDLVTDFERSIARVRGFLGIEAHPTLSQPTRAGRSWGGNSMFDDRFTDVSTSPVGRFRREVTPARVARLEAALRPEMRDLGYELEEGRSIRAWIRWQTYRARRSAQALKRRLLAT